jgi:hypothetical protein
MRQLLLGLCLCLAACTTPLSITPAAAPAPLAQTTVDDKALDEAWKAYEIAIDAVDLAITLKAIVPGSPKAAAIADANDKVLAAFQLAEHAAAGLSTTSYVQALAQLDAALADLKVVLRRKP